MEQNGKYFDCPQTEADYDLIDHTSVDYDCIVTHSDGAQWLVRFGNWRKINNL
jgi:hypothetical protein